MAESISVLGWVLLGLGIGSAAFSVVSVLDGILFHMRVSHSLVEEKGYNPKVVVLVPVRGLEPTLGLTLPALLNQDYEDYDVVFITDPDDEAGDYLRELDLPRLVTIAEALPLKTCSGKIAALLAGLKYAEEAEVLVFADSDIEPDRDWLASLVAPLKDPQVAASTGYRWYFQTKPGLGPALQSAWNSAAGSVMFSPKWVYLWGGSYAIRTDVLPTVSIEELWVRSLSDDMVMTQALKEAGLQVTFAPRATVANYTEASVGEVIRWTNRQACLALLYAPSMAGLTLPYVIHLASLALAIISLPLLQFPLAFLTLLLFLSPLYAGIVKNAVRRWAFRRAMPAFRGHFGRHVGWYYLGVLVLPFLMIYNVLKARRMTELRWRGKVYRFSSPEDVELVSD